MVMEEMVGELLVIECGREIRQTYCVNLEMM